MKHLLALAVLIATIAMHAQSTSTKDMQKPMELFANFKPEIPTPLK